MERKVFKVQSFDSHSSRLESRAVLPLKGPITTDKCDELKAVIYDFIDKNKTEIILDCKNLSFLDSRGLELLFSIHEDLKKRNGILKLAALNEVCRDILVATRLVNIFNIYNDVHEAIQKWQ